MTDSERTLREMIDSLYDGNPITATQPNSEAGQSALDAPLEALLMEAASLIDLLEVCLNYE